MKLYNAWYCPFAQRVWMALIHKDIDFDYVEVDPYNKTDWWVKVSRGAELVPVLVEENENGDGETTIIESNRILEFLDDCFPHRHQSSPRMRLSVPNRNTGWIISVTTSRPTSTAF